MKKQSSRSVKRISTLFLQAVVVLVGIIALALLLIEPSLEGANAHASLAKIYFGDPFLAYVYIGSIPFFVALVQAFKLLGCVARDKVFSQAAVNTLKVIKYCAFITAGVVVAAIVYIRLAAMGSHDDPAGAVMLGNLATFISIVIGTAAAIFQKTLQSAVDIKSEHDLTV